MNPTIEIHEKNRFSVYADGTDADKMRVLVMWVRWFRHRRIKAVLAHTPNGWAVYRNGLTTL